MRKGLLSIAAFLMAILAIGCGGSSSSSSETSSQAFQIPIPGGKAKVRYENEVKVGPSGLAGPEPKPVFPQGEAPDFTSLVDLIDGIGELHYEGDPVTLQYVGYDYDTHKKFASSWDEGKPFKFTLGKGEVIPGWEEGLVELENGDRRELVVPPGETEGPFPKGIPEGHAAIFVVEGIPTRPLAEQQGKPTASKPPKVAKNKDGSNKTKPKIKVPSGPPPTKLEIKDLEEGSGPAAKPGDMVTVHYVGVNYKTGKQFDASWDRGEPFTFELGSHGVIEGWEKGIPGMKPGGRRELIIPPELGYGYQRSGSIPPGSTLVFVVDLISVE